MKTLSTKCISLFGAVLAMCAVIVPSMASAASWGAIGTTHVLNSPNFRFDVHLPIGLISMSCAGGSEFHVDVANAAALRVTGGALNNCTVGGAGGHCTATATPTRFPWTITGPTVNNVQIHGIQIDVRFETLPGGSPPACSLNNQTATVTGTVTLGTWFDPFHEVFYTGAPGLTMHSAMGLSTVTLTSTIRDTTNTLTLA
jgi:hypothetical protein